MSVMLTYVGYDHIFTLPNRLSHRMHAVASFSNSGLEYTATHCCTGLTLTLTLTLTLNHLKCNVTLTLKP